MDEEEYLNSIPDITDVFYSHYGFSYDKHFV